MEKHELAEIYKDMADTAWSDLEAATKRHITTWTKDPQLTHNEDTKVNIDSCGTDTAKKRLRELQIGQLDNQMRELFDIYNGPVFSDFQKIGEGQILLGEGHLIPDIVVVYKYPTHVSVKEQKVLHYAKSKKKNKNRELVDSIWATQPSETIHLLKEKGLEYKRFYAMYIIPFRISTKEPTQLLASLFSTYAKRRLEILRPKVVVVAGSWESKFVYNKMKPSNLVRALNVTIGSSKKMIYQMIGGKRMSYSFTLCRIPHPWSINPSNATSEEIRKAMMTQVNPVVTVIKNITYTPLVIRPNSSKGSGAIDLLSFMKRGVIVTSSSTPVKKKNPFANNPHIRTLQKSQEIVGAEINTEPNENERTNVSPEIDWIVDHTIGLVGMQAENDLIKLFEENKVSIKKYRRCKGV